MTGHFYGLYRTSQDIEAAFFWFQIYDALAWEKRKGDGKGRLLLLPDTRAL